MDANLGRLSHIFQAGLLFFLPGERGFFRGKSRSAEGGDEFRQQPEKKGNLLSRGNGDLLSTFPSSLSLSLTILQAYSFIDDKLWTGFKW